MKNKSILLVTASICLSLTVVAFRQRRADPAEHIRPQFDARLLKAIPIPGATDPGHDKANITRLRSFKLPPSDEGILSGFQFDGLGRVWFEVRNGGSEFLSILDPSTGETREVHPPTVDAGAQVMGFTLADDGIYFIVTHLPRRGSIVHSTEDGVVKRVIDTGRFLPTALHVDGSGRIWAMGQLFTSTSQDASFLDGQMRVYDPESRLSSIPLMGLSATDAGFGFIRSTDRGMAYVCPYRREEFLLGETEARTIAAPFAQPKQLQAQTSTQALPQPPNQILSGVWPIDPGELWYGMNATAPGAYGQGLIRMVSANGTAISPELWVPRQFGMLEAVDSTGLMYFAWHDDKEGLQLVQCRLTY